MDHAVALVQSYLQLNGYFTSAESPIIASAGRRGFRTITDIDVLAFRFPSGLDAARSVPVRQRAPRGLDTSELDPGLGVTPDLIDMVVGEVKEGRVGINNGARDPEVLKAVISRLGQTGEEDRAVADLLQTGVARVSSGVIIRFIAFGAFPPGAPVPPCRIISLGHVGLRQVGLRQVDSDQFKLSQAGLHRLRFGQIDLGKAVGLRIGRSGGLVPACGSDGRAADLFVSRFRSVPAA